MKSAPIPIYRTAQGAQLLPYHLPDQENGKISITSRVEPKGSVYAVVSMRNAIFMGMEPERIVFQEPTRIHFMKDQHGVFMSTIPQEIEQMYRQSLGAYGRVLVGGLGLGVVVAAMDKNPRVTSITVLEINRKVIQLVSPYLKTRNTTIVLADLRKALKTYKELGLKFDFAFYDTWRGTGEYDHYHEVLPLRKLSEGIVPQLNIECWNEEEMLGQIYQGLHSFILFRHNERFKQFNPETNYWKKNSRYAFMKYLAQENPSDEQALTMLSDYIVALKDPARFNKHWAKYNKKGKQTNDKRQTQG